MTRGTGIQRNKGYSPVITAAEGDGDTARFSGFPSKLENDDAGCRKPPLWIPAFFDPGGTGFGSPSGTLSWCFFLWQHGYGVLLVEVKQEGDAVGFVVERAAFI